MDWATVANLIINIGIPAAEDIIQRWETGTPVTLADFQAIRDKANQTASDRMKLAITKAGFTLDDPKVQALLGLSSAPVPLTVAPPPAAVQGPSLPPSTSEAPPVTAPSA